MTEDQLSVISELVESVKMVERDYRVVSSQSYGWFKLLGSYRLQCRICEREHDQRHRSTQPMHHDMCPVPKILETLKRFEEEAPTVSLGQFGLIHRVVPLLEKLVEVCFKWDRLKGEKGTVKQQYEAEYEFWIAVGKLRVERRNIEVREGRRWRIKLT